MPVYFYIGYVYLLFTAPCGASQPCFWSLGSILGAPTAPLCNSLTVQRSTDNMITHTRQISYAPPTNEYDGVLLQIMPFAWDVSVHFHPVT